MRRFLILSALYTLAMIQPALAAPAVSGYNWTGIYLGGNIGET